jgi:tRNA/rRNA methyltransferase
MANFGFERLSVVAPYEAHWREARSAVGAPELLQNAKETATLAEAIAGCTLVIGTGTLTARKPEQQVIALPSLAPLVQSELERGGRIALVFGPEKRGLTRDDLSHCHLLVEIPTDQRQPSMNLGQAVAVCLYELATRVFLPDQFSGELRPQSSGTNVTAETLDLLGEVIGKTMNAAGYSPPEMEAANRHDLRLLLRRLNLNRADAKRALGVFRRILWRLERRRP